MREKKDHKNKFLLYRISGTIFIILSIPLISNGESNILGYASLIAGIFIFSLSNASKEGFIDAHDSSNKSNGNSENEDNRK